MGRPPRIEEPGCVYHVTSRGNCKQNVFLDRIDYTTFLDRALRVARRHRWIVYAYCLMPNHWHVLLEIPFRGLSAGVQELNGGHARMFNRRHRRMDHLFRNRFYAGLVERDSHLVATSRYIELNPVRAGLCRSPEEWPWSSYRAHASLDVGHPLLAVGEVLRMFDERPDRAARAYRAFVQEECDALSRAGVNV